MKKTLVILTMILGVSFANAQAYSGKDDAKFQVGINFQENGTGIVLGYDYGMGENFSIGATTSYILGVEEVINADFVDRFDVKVRFNANLGSVMELPDNMDVYPGLNLGLKNFGGHLGTRYFFSDGFGLFAEASLPFAKYKTESLTPAEELHNQFVFSFGAVFNL
jgi:hypothetical protein